MIDRFEAELREALTRQAAAVPADAVARLRRIDYQPHTRRRWPLTVSAVGAASGAAAVSAVVLGGSQPAFAGWSAQPTPPAQLQSATTAEGCQAQVATVPGGTGQGGWSQVASDSRGPYTMVVYENGTGLASCFTGPSFTTVQAESLDSATGGMAVSASGVVAPGPHVSSNEVQLLSGGDINQLLVSHLSQDGNAYTLVEGRVASTVSAVTLVLSDGQHVATTTGSGWIVAWWPGSQDVTSTQVTSAGGTTTEPLIKSSFPQPPPLASDSGSVPIHGSSSGPLPPPPRAANS